MRLTNGCFRVAVCTTALLALPQAASASEAGQEWEFALSPLFLWAQSVNGDSTLRGNTSELNLDFKDDILTNLEGALTFHVEARRGKATLFAQYMFSDLEPGAEATGELAQANVDVDFEELISEVGATWAISETQATRWEFLGGARYIDQELKGTLTLTLPEQERVTAVRGGDDWWHMFAGLRVAHSLSDRWTLRARGDLGYGGTDNTAFNASLMFDYRFSDWGAAFIGARYLYLDYLNSDEFGFDGTKAGPAAGVTLRW
jgi:hypothetical protein